MKIFLVDDHVLFRDGLITMLEDQQGYVVVGQAGNVSQALEQIPKSGADLVLMDIILPDGNGLDASRQLLSLCPNLTIVILTIYETDELLYESLRSGAKGYILKNSPKAHFLASLKAIESGEAALSRKLIPKLIDEFTRLGKVQPPDAEAKFELLTYRELEVLQHLGNGSSNLEIAKKMSITENTVKSHIHNIYKKLKFRNRNEARNFASRFGRINGDFRHPQ